MRPPRGYVLIELLIAVAIAAGIAASLLTVTSPSLGAFAVQPEAADMQQRLRVATDVLTSDLVMAGSGAYAGALTGPLDFFFAPVLPYRHGGPGADTAGTFRGDAITVIYVPSTPSQTTAAVDLTGGTFVADAGPGCPVGADACGFVKGDTMLAYDTAGNFDTFSVASAMGGGGSMTPNSPVGVAVYRAGAKLAKAVERTYDVERDATGQFDELVARDGSSKGAVPVVDHVVALSFEYFGEPQPPALRTPGVCDQGAPPPCTTYGPAPPPPGVQATAYPPGENCIFSVDGLSGLQVPRLGVIGGDSTAVALVPLPASRLTDGPWCPDASSPNRFDADLLRIRMIRVTLRVEAAVDSLRGPAGMLFTRGGTGRGTAVIPDRQIAFAVTPRNLNFAR